MTSLDALDAWRSFLETTPPNTPVEIPDLLDHGILHPVPDRGGTLHIRPIRLFCSTDDGPRRFDPSPISIVLSDLENYVFVRYLCRDCRTYTKTIAILITCDKSDVKTMKLGEYPPFSAPISSRIQNLLSTSDLDLYRKGCRAESQGLGIGAATYFRRIVESQWKSLVTELRRASETLGTADLGRYDAALKENSFSKAVDILRDVIPDKLLIQGKANPLLLLYKPLSKQLHELSDVECLQQAMDIRVILTALLDNVAVVLKDQKEIHDATKRLNKLR